MSAIGCPDFKGLILLELASFAQEEHIGEEMLQQAILAVKERARFKEKLYCLTEAGNRLQKSKNQKFQKLGAQVAKDVARLEKSAA